MLAEPWGSAESRLKITALDSTVSHFDKERSGRCRRLDASPPQVTLRDLLTTGASMTTERRAWGGAVTVRDQ